MSQIIMPKDQGLEVADVFREHVALSANIHLSPGSQKDRNRHLKLPHPKAGRPN